VDTAVELADSVSCCCGCSSSSSHLLLLLLLLLPGVCIYTRPPRLHMPLLYLNPNPKPFIVTFSAACHDMHTY
jgi:hypothetical protein